MTVLEYLGICNGDIEHAARIVEESMKECGFNEVQIDGMYENFKLQIGFCDSFWDDPTNAIIDCLFNEASHFIEERTDYQTDFYVNGWDSHFNVKKV